MALQATAATALAADMTSESFRLRGGTFSASGATGLGSEAGTRVGEAGTTAGQPGPVGLSVGSNVLLLTLRSGFWHVVGGGAAPCAAGDDPDGDGVCSSRGDNCPNVENRSQADADGNRIGDSCQCGDVDGNGLTNTVDALRIARGEVPSADPNFGKCDVNGDGQCNTLDALEIARGEVSSRPRDQLCPTYSGTR